MKHIKNSKGGIIKWGADDWHKGLGAGGSFSATNYLQQTQADGFLSLSKIDPFRFYGSVCPGYYSGATASGGSLAGVISAGAFYDNTTAYLVDAGGKIHSYNVSTNTLSSAGSFPHTITGTTPVGQDGIIYRHKITATTYSTSFFYSYYNSLNWNVGVYSGFSTFDDTFMSGTIDTPRLDITTASPADGKDVDQRTAPHPMEIGADGVLYIGSGRYVHAYDGNAGTAGTFSSRVLTLPLGFQIVAMKKLQNIFLITGNYYNQANSTGEALLYTWDYVSSDITSVVSLEDNSVSSLFLWNGAPTVTTYGVTARNGGNKIKMISGNSVTKLADFDGTAPANRGIVVINDIIYLNAGGKIIAMGDKYKKSYDINHLYSTSQQGTSGALLWTDLQQGFVASAGVTPCLNIMQSSNGTGDGNLKTFYFDPEFDYMKIGRVKSVTVKYYGLCTAGAGTMSLQLFTDNSSTSSLVINALDTVALPLQKRYSQTTAGAPLPSFSTVALSLVWPTVGASPVVSTVELEYELLDVPLVV